MKRKWNKYEDHLLMSARRLFKGEPGWEKVAQSDLRERDYRHSLKDILNRALE